MQVDLIKVCAAFPLHPHNPLNPFSPPSAKVDPKKVEADFIELTFTGQYLGRADMWRLGMSLEGRCVHVWEKVEFAGIVKAEVKGIYVRGKRVRVSSVVAAADSKGGKADEPG